MFYEMTLGVKSYWFPYFRQMPYVSFTANWNDEELIEVQNDQLISAMKDYSVELETQWHLFKAVLI